MLNNVSPAPTTCTRYPVSDGAARVDSADSTDVPLFGIRNRWLTHTKLAHDPADPAIIVVTVGPETLRIHTAQQTPKEKIAEQGPHFGITSIDNFDIADAADMQQIAGIEGFIGGVAGQGAVDNLEKVFGAFAANRRQPPMIKKIGLLSVNRDPRTASARSILHTHPFRNDPVVRNRLDMITKDQRYDNAVRERARMVLDDNVPLEELISVGL